jgi:hypothetical protein
MLDAFCEDHVTVALPPRASGFGDTFTVHDGIAEQVSVPCAGVVLYPAALFEYTVTV